MKYNYVILFCLLTLAISCKKNDQSFDDYRQEYIGTYDCTKSNKSFDDPFQTDIKVTVLIDSTDVTHILVNEVAVMLLDDGTFGEGPFEGGIEGDFIKFSHRPIINGLVLPCYIQGRKE